MDKEELINNSNKIILSNNESLEFIDFINNKELYKFTNIKNESIYISFLDQNGFQLYDSYENFLNNINYFSNAFKLPNIKKYNTTLRYIHNNDNLNFFCLNNINIGHINTTYESFYDKKLNKTYYTKYSDTSEYLLKKNNKIGIFLYCKNKGFSITNRSMNYNDLNEKNKYEENIYDTSKVKNYIDELNLDIINKIL